MELQVKFLEQKIIVFYQKILTNFHNMILIQVLILSKCTKLIKSDFVKQEMWILEI